MGAILRWLSGLVCTSGSDNGAGLGRILPTAARAANSQLELGVHLLWLTQDSEMPEKSTPSTLPGRLLIAHATADVRLSSTAAENWWPAL